MKIQICYYDSDESNILKLKFKESLLYFLNITNNSKIDDIFYDLKCYQYIIIDDKQYYLSDKMLNTDIFKYVPFYEFIDMIELLKICNNNTFIINLNNFKDYNILNETYFEIHNVVDYEPTFNINNFSDYGNLSLLIINNIAYIIDSNYSIFFFKYNKINSDVFIRNIKLKNIISS